jgi:hypothetical protein
MPLCNPSAFLAATKVGLRSARCAAVLAGVTAASALAQSPPPRWSNGGPSAQRPTAAPAPVGVLAARCADGGEPVPRLSRLVPLDPRQRLVELSSDQAAAYWDTGPGTATVAAPSGHLAPGDTFELTGACFGETPGTVALVFAGRPSRPNAQAQTLTLSADAERAELVDWSDTRVRVRVPPGLAGRMPGRMALQLTHHNGQSSNTLAADFWPEWEAVSLMPWVRLTACHSNPDEPGACRAGDQQMAAVAGFMPPATRAAPLAARHACRAPQRCDAGRASTPSDRYTLELPAWVLPVVERVSFDHRYRRSAHSRESPPKLRLLPAVPQSTPDSARQWHLDIHWSLAESGDELSYAVDLRGLRPRGTGQPSRPGWSAAGTPPAPLSTVKNPFLKQQP